MNNVAELQQEALGICKRICRLCEQNHLRYYIAAGTLLGAVRHKGFIPWDDDMDLEMPRQDYQKLQKLLEQDGQFICQNYHTDHGYPYPFTKVFLRSEETEKLRYPALNRCGHAFVDIFPLSGCPSNGTVSRVYFKGIELLTVVMLSKVHPKGVLVCGYTRKYMRLLFWLFRCMPAVILQRLCLLMVAFFDRFSDGVYIGYAGGKYGYPWERYRREWYQDAISMPFADTEFHTPAAWDALLRHKYGDYMVPPVPEERRGHFD